MGFGEAKGRIPKNRLAAAESYIRDRLQEEGLEVRNIDDAFGELLMGSVTAEAL